MSRLARPLPCAAVLTALAAGPAPGQLIQIRTIPLAASDQFEIFPSHTFGMGGVSIALRDSLRDPFVNPALGSRLPRGDGFFFSAPTVYSISRNSGGGGRTLPLGAAGRAGAWFGGLALALQQIEPSPRQFDGDFAVPADHGPVIGPPNILPPIGIQPVRRRHSHGNTYLFGMAGRRVGGGVALGASASWARLRGIDGVELLYNGSAAVAQSGSDVDLRLGLTREWDRRGVLQLILLHHRYDMTHDVTYLDAFWDPAHQTFSQRERQERNRDRTTTWGGHLAWDRVLAEDWRVGGVVTVNRAEHPQLPGYELVGLPRDPGTSWAYNVGVGFAKRSGPVSFGVDMIVEPIRSHTWAADSTGRRTVDNRFDFGNAHMRLGVSREFKVPGRGRMADVQLGLAIRSIDYELEQINHLDGTSGGRLEHWVEWSPTWGFSFRFPDLEIRYRGRSTNGAGRAFANSFGPGPILDRGTSAGSSVLALPGALLLQDVTVVTHQIALALPLRRTSGGSAR